MPTGFFVLTNKLCWNLKIFRLWNKWCSDNSIKPKVLYIIKELLGITYGFLQIYKIPKGLEITWDLVLLAGSTFTLVGPYLTRVDSKPNDNNTTCGSLTCS